MNCLKTFAPLVAIALLTAAPTLSQTPTRGAPVAVPVADTIPAPLDIPFPGTIRLAIDARDLTRGVFRVTETVPVPSGRRELVLLVPEWLPGKHAPRPNTNKLADFRFTVDGAPARWLRDAVDVNAFRVSLPEGAKELTVAFVFTSPLQSSEGRVVMTQEMLNLQFDAMSLYPAGHYVRQVRVAPAVTFPEGWTVFTALDGQVTQGGVTRWNETDYETLVDSPIFAGKYARRWDLGHDVWLDTVADNPEQLEIAPENLDAYRRLVEETLALFGGRHFDKYNMLLAMTERMGGIGLEHLRSSENSHKSDTLIKWAAMDFDRGVIPHELTHSWNGKYRRPAGLWSPDYRQPMRNNLLWVYEGQSQFWGYVLAARSGVQSKATVLGMLATAAGYYSIQPGRAWRSLEDTTHDPIANARRALPYSSFSRSEDYYTEGLLIWLEVDQVIREGTGGAKGLDQFAHDFFGLNDGDQGQLTYEFDDVVTALNAIHPYDWKAFFDKRLGEPGQPAPIAGIEMAGYRLVWKEEPNPYDKARYDNASSTSLIYSLGFNLDKEGKVSSPVWDSPAFNAGIVTGAQIVAVNGEGFSKSVILDAVKEAKFAKQPIELLIKRGTRYLTVPLRYYGGLRYPWLEPAEPGEQPLDRLLAPRTGG